MIFYSFKKEITSYVNYGDRLIKILEKDSSKNHPQYAGKVVELIKKNRSWVKELVDMRVQITHYSDLIGLSCFLIKRSGENAKIATVFYPAMPNGQRVSTFMDQTWANIQELIRQCSYLLVNRARGGELDHILRTLLDTAKNDVSRQETLDLFKKIEDDGTEICQEKYELYEVRHLEIKTLL